MYQGVLDTGNDSNAVMVKPNAGARTKFLVLDFFILELEPSFSALTFQLGTSSMDSKLTGKGAAKSFVKKSIDVKKMSERQTKAGNLKSFLMFFLMFSNVF